MQPYFLPYIGYWQLLEHVDEFVLYDNIQYTKKGWINRNRFLRGSAVVTFTVPVKKGRSCDLITDRFLADDFQHFAERLKRRMHNAYQHAAYVSHGLKLLEACLVPESKSLFSLISCSIHNVAERLGITTPIVYSSQVPCDPNYKAADRVIAICQARNASTYVNPSSGRALYEREQFENQGLTLQFLTPRIRPYTQGDHDFVPALSVIDILMHYSGEELRESGHLTPYSVAQ